MNAAQYWWMPLALGLIAAAFPFAATRFGRKGDRENQLIDQLQEEMTEARGDLKTMRAELDSLKALVTKLTFRDSMWRFRDDQLNAIIVGLGGDPVELPEVLKEGL